MTGERAPAAVQPSGDGGLAAIVELEPYASRFLVFSAATGPTASPGAPLLPGGSAGTDERQGGQNTAGRGQPVPAALDISAGWSVSFGGRPPVQMTRLESWTENETTRYYSGLATYEKDVDVPEQLVRNGLSVRLDFGEGHPVPVSGAADRLQAWLDAPIRDAAVVELNGRRAGSIWCPPYSIDVTGLLERGRNRLRIVVGNLAINHMAGHASPSYRLLNLRYGARFEPQDMDKVQPIPAGLLGPIRLIPYSTGWRRASM
jgi:hypothetical protein